MKRRNAHGQVRVWASRFRTCAACGYKTQLSRSFRNPVTGGSFKETECYFCNAYTCVEVQPVVTYSDSSMTRSTAGGDSSWGGGSSNGGGEGGDF
eukprot:s1098_g2.t1